MLSFLTFDEISLFEKISRIVFKDAENAAILFLTFVFLDV